MFVPKGTTLGGISDLLTRRYAIRAQHLAEFSIFSLSYYLIPKRRIPQLYYEEEGLES
jgi:hypothetical protein